MCFFHMLTSSGHFDFFVLQYQKTPIVLFQNILQIKHDPFLNKGAAKSSFFYFRRGFHK